MDEAEKRELIEQYLQAYNTFDVEGMIALMHPDLIFRNITSGRVDVETAGLEQFRNLAEGAASIFRERKQTIRDFKAEGDRAWIVISYVGVLTADLPNGMKAGESIRIEGRSEFTFKDGKIYALLDIIP